MERPRRRRQSAAAPVRRGIFGGNVTVRVGLLVVFICMLFLQFYNRMYEGARLNGPIDDVFKKKSAKLAIIYPESDNALAGYSLKVAGVLGKKLDRKIPVYSDRKAGRKVLNGKSLILYGPVPQNAVARGMSGGFPFRFDGRRLGWGRDRWLASDDWRLVFITTNPRSRTQYVLVYTAATSDRVVGINFIESPNFVPHDSTDYVLAVGDSILAAGYFDKDSSGVWSLPDGALTSLGR